MDGSRCVENIDGTIDQTRRGTKHVNLLLVLLARIPICI